MKWLLGSFFACILSVPAAAQEIDFAKWSNACRATAEKPASPLAQKIADVARQEKDIFKGHAVDPAGRITRWGNTEVEADATENGRVKDRSEIPWQNVQRYWSNLSGVGPSQSGVDDAQGVLYYPKLADGQVSTLDRRNIPVKRLLRAIRDMNIPAENGDAEAIREALRESVLRASISDTAWSAAFVSSVMDDAGVPRMKFARSVSHISYITDAVNRSLADLKNEPGEDLYRACDPFNTKARPGDLICYHRESYAPRKGLSLHRSLMLDIASGAKPISATHCEIVIEVDTKSKKIRTVGGNVQQAVTERTLNINKNDVLSAAYGTKPCDRNGLSDRDRNANCNLNDQAWFVLLQAR